jgi:membrane protease YdiL (CAAX protease family)
MFILLTALFGVFIGWLRVASGSVFVATMAHASFNAFVQSFFGISFVGDGAWFLIGDYGILTLITYGALVAWLYWSKKVPATLTRRNIAI